MIRRGVRRAAPRDDDGWRGSGRSGDFGSGVPGILGQVLIEVAKQAARSKGFDLDGGPWGGSSPGRRTSMPRPGRSSPRPGSSGSGRGRSGGGFKTGGGF
jgi:hypothetical protein